MTTTHHPVPEPQEGTMTKYYRSTETIPGFGVVDMMTDTGYKLVGGGFAPFTKVHPQPAAAGLVIFSDGTRYGG